MHLDVANSNIILLKTGKKTHTTFIASYVATCKYPPLYCYYYWCMFLNPQSEPVFHVLRALPAVDMCGDIVFAVGQHSVVAVRVYLMHLVMPKMLGVML